MTDSSAHMAIPRLEQFLDLEAAIIRLVYGMDVFRAEEVSSSDFSSKPPYAYKQIGANAWSIVYSQGTISITPMRSLDGAYFTAAKTLQWLHKNRGGGYYDISCSPSFSADGAMFLRFTVTFEHDRDHVISRASHEFLEVAMGLACLRACGREVDEKTWSVK